MTTSSGHTNTAAAIPAVAPATADDRDDAVLAFPLSVLVFVLSAIWLCFCFWLFPPPFFPPAPAPAPAPLMFVSLFSWSVFPPISLSLSHSLVLLVVVVVFVEWSGVEWSGVECLLVSLFLCFSVSLFLCLMRCDALRGRDPLT